MMRTSHKILVGMVGLAFAMVAKNASATTIVAELPLRGRRRRHGDRQPRSRRRRGVDQLEEQQHGGLRLHALGTGGLNDNYSVHAPAAGSYIEIASSATPTTPFCGFTVNPLRYGGWTFDLVGGSGNDYLYSYGSGDTYLTGGDGNDKLWDNRPGAHVTGGPGNDNLRTPDNQYGILDGGDGNDCLTTGGFSILRLRVTCGSGADILQGGHFGGGPGSSTDCEDFTSSCSL